MQQPVLLPVLLRPPSIEHGSCTLLDRYEFSEILGSGVFGSVLKMTEHGRVAVAVKLQRVDVSIAQVGNMIHLDDQCPELIIDKFIDHMIDDDLLPFLELHAWSICSNDSVAKRLKQLGVDLTLLDTLPSLLSSSSSSSSNDWAQISVHELATEGTLYDAIKLAPDQYLGAGQLRPILAQVLAGLAWLNERIEFTHHDLHLNNILLSRHRPSSSSPPPTHCYWRFDESIVVPIAESRVVKISDLGFARMCVKYGAEHYTIGTARSLSYRPAFDLHKLAVSLLGVMISCHLSQGSFHYPITWVDPQLLSLLRGWILRVSGDTKSYQSLMHTFDRLIQNRVWPYKDNKETWRFDEHVLGAFHVSAAKLGPPNTREITPRMALRTSYFDAFQRKPTANERVIAAREVFHLPVGYETMTS